MTTRFFTSSLSYVLFQSSTIFSPPSHFHPVVERTDMLLKEMKWYFRAVLGWESTRGMVHCSHRL